MKLLQNPAVVIILAGLALGLVLKNAILPMIKRGGGARSLSRSAVPPAKAATVAVQSEARPAQPAVSGKESLAEKPGESMPVPSADINLPEVLSGSTRWTASPRRDPFQFERRGQDGPSARDLLKLSGIWRQANSTLAVLNNRVIHEGENILGFTVQTVESDRVWVQGPNGRESLEFKYPVPDEAQTVEAKASDLAGAE
jgi:hypothetical protein